MAKTLQQQTYDSRIRQLSKYDSIITPDELDSIHLETTESEFKKILDSLKIRIAKEVPAIQKSPNAEISDQLKKFNYFNFIPKFDEDDDFIRITDEEKSFKEYLKLLHSLPKNKLMDFVEYKANGIFIWRVNQYGKNHEVLTGIKIKNETPKRETTRIFVKDAIQFNTAILDKENSKHGLSTYYFLKK